MWYANPQGEDQQYVPVLFRHLQTGSGPCERRAGHVVPAGDFNRHERHSHEGVLQYDFDRQAGHHSDEDCRCQPAISCLISAFSDFSSLNETERRGLGVGWIVSNSYGLSGRVIGCQLATVYKYFSGTPVRGLLDALPLSIWSNKSAILSPVGYPSAWSCSYDRSTQWVWCSLATSYPIARLESIIIGRTNQ